MTTRSMRHLGAFVFAALALAACGDDGGNNSATCGDSTVGGAEQCDDGNTTSGDGCSATCQTESAGTCGDSTINTGEQCDDGNTAGGDGCSATCQTEGAATCGNGALDGSEACDDGDTMSGDGCSSACAVEVGYTCTGTPSVCTVIPPNGMCGSPYVLALTNTAGTFTGTATGDTATSTNQVGEAACDGETSGGGKDHVWSFTIAAASDVTIVLDDTITTHPFSMRLMSTPCTLASELPEYAGADGCFNAATNYLGYVNLAPGTYYVVMDGFATADAGPYAFTVEAVATTCGDGTLDLLEFCDDGDLMTGDGCDNHCDVEPGYVCDTNTDPSVCTLACGNGTIDVAAGEECDDGGVIAGDRCSATCKLEFDTMETEPTNNTTPQMLTAGNHIVRGVLGVGDVDLYSFTLTAPSTVELETYDAINGVADYTGRGTLTQVDCLDADIDTEVRLFASGADVTMNPLALFFDDDDGDGLCSYVGPNDGPDLGATLPTEGVLAAGTYVIKVNEVDPTIASPWYILDLKITPATVAPVAPVAGDLVINEYLASDSTTGDSNCDGSTTGTVDEFVELVNVSGHPLDLTGVTIADPVTTRHVFAPGASGSMTLAPNKAIVVWGGGAPACTGVTNWFIANAPTAITQQLGLDDAGDTITVATGGATPVTITSLTYTAADVTAAVSRNRSPDITGTTYVLHNTLSAAGFSPGTKANGTAF